MQAKFQDTTKLENLDAQIFYYTEQVRCDTSVFDNTAALALMPKLVQLLDARINMAADDAKQANLYRFRKAVVLQDMAQVKIALLKPDDSLYHLQEAERLLRDAKADDEVAISKVVMRAATARSHDLNQKAQAERLKQQEEPPMPDYKTLQEQRKLMQERTRRNENSLYVGIFIASSIACYKLINRMIGAAE